MSERSTQMSETIEQLKARLKKEEEEKEEAFRKNLEEAKDANAKWRADREAEERAKEQERQRLVEGARQNRENETKDRARLAWIDAGGTGEEFEEEWPAMRRQMLRESALNRDSEAREASRQSILRGF